MADVVPSISRVTTVAGGRYCCIPIPTAIIVLPVTVSITITKTMSLEESAPECPGQVLQHLDGIVR